MNDFRFAVRQLFKQPAFTVVAIITLALGVGANSAVFGLINALIVRSLPYQDSSKLVLAAVGTYGVISYFVIQRTHEIGVRMALGAQARDVLALVIGHAMRLVAIGILVGLILAMFSTRALRALLYNVGAFDFVTFATVALVLGAVALLASYVPALRATRADPMVTLGHNG